MEDDLIFLDGEVKKEERIEYTPPGGWLTHPEHAAPIEIILRLYLNNRNALYINNMEGFLLLRDWLGIGIKKEGYREVPNLLSNYEIMRMSQALKVPDKQIFWTLLEINDE